MLSAASTDGRSRATISRSRGSIKSASSSIHRPVAGRIDEPAQQGPEGLGGARIAQLVVFVERRRGIAHRELLGQNGRAAAELEHLAQRHQRTVAAKRAGGSGAERKHPIAIGGERR